MVIIHYPTSFQALDEYVDRHNEEYESISAKLRSSVVMTAKEIIRIYGVFLLKANGVEQLSADKLPALKTNNAQLAKLVKSSTRTIQRHIIKLQQAGIIIGKKFKGSNGGYELLINPKILLARCRKSAEQAEKELEEAKNEYTEKENLKRWGTTKCPHTYTGNNSYNKSNLLIAVENSKVSYPEAGARPADSFQDGERKRSSLSLTNKNDTTGNILTGNTRKKAPKAIGQQEIFEKEAREKAPGRVEKNWKQQVPNTRGASLSLAELMQNAGFQRTGNIRTGNTREKAPKEASQQNSFVGKLRKETPRPMEDNWKQQATDKRQEMIRFYVERLWNLARNLLYKEIFLTEFQVQQAKSMLEKWYEPVADNKLLTVHQNYCERVYLVREFIARDPENRFVQLPYKYFDTNNKTGFTGTKIWYAKHKKRKEEVRKKLVLHSQIRKYLNNEKKPQDKKRSVLEVYRECEARVGKLKDRDLLKLFHASVLNPEIIQQIS